MPTAEITTIRPAATDRLSLTEWELKAIFDQYPPLTPVSMQELIKVSWPDSFPWKKDEIGNVLGAQIFRLRNKLPQQLNIYNLHGFGCFFIGPTTKPGEKLTLARLPQIDGANQPPQGIESLFAPFYQVKIGSGNRANFRVSPIQFKLLLALSNHGFNQPFPIEALLSAIFPQDHLPSPPAKSDTARIQTHISRLRLALPPNWEIPKKYDKKTSGYQLRQN